MSGHYEPALGIGLISESPTNPRQRFDAVKLEELAASIAVHGVLQAVVVRPVEGGRYELVAGARRFRATQIAGLGYIPATVRELSAKDVLEIQLLENNQREDVHPLEEAEAMRRALDAKVYGEGKAAIEKMAGKLGRSVKYVYDRLKLAELSDEAKEEFLAGNLTAGHAILIARLADSGQRACITHLFYWARGSERGERRPEPLNFSVRNLADWIAENVHHELKLAPFDRLDPLLVKRAGACDKCPKRTGADADLTGENGSDRCQDPSCWQKKTAAHVDHLIRSLKDEGHELFAISSSWGWGTSSKAHGLPLLYSNAWKRSERPTGTKGIVVDSNRNCRLYEVVDIVTVGRDGKMTAAEQAAIDQRQKLLAARKRNIGKTYRQELRAAIEMNMPTHLSVGMFISIATSKVVGGSHDLRPLASLLGLGVFKDSTTKARAAVEVHLRGSTESELVRAMVLVDAAYQLDTEAVSDWAFDEHRLTAAEAVARSLGIEPSNVLKRVQERFPKPGEAKPKKPKKGAAQTSAPEEDLTHA